MYLDVVSVISRAASGDDHEGMFGAGTEDQMKAPERPNVGPGLWVQPGRIPKERGTRAQCSDISIRF